MASAASMMAAGPMLPQPLVTKLPCSCRMAYMPEMASCTSSAVWIWIRMPRADRRRTSSTPCANAASAWGHTSLQEQ